MRSPWLTLLVLAGLAACAKEHAPAQLDAHVTADQFALAKQIVSRIDYLPFGYTADGCFARSYYMSMELAAERIPSSAQAVNVCNPGATSGAYDDPDNLLRLADGTAWSWHVAPLVMLDGAEYVVDPAMAPEPMRRHDWMSYMSHQLPVNFHLVPAAHPGSGFRDEDTCNLDTGYDQMIGSFAELAPFDASYVASNCAYMHTYIGKLTSISDPTKAAMQERLIERTKFLVARLKDLGKFQEFAALDYDVECRFNVEQ